VPYAYRPARRRSAIRAAATMYICIASHTFARLRAWRPAPYSQLSHDSALPARTLSLLQLRHVLILARFESSIRSALHVNRRWPSTCGLPTSAPQRGAACVPTCDIAVASKRVPPSCPPTGSSPLAHPEGEALDPSSEGRSTGRQAEAWLN